MVSFDTSVTEAQRWFAEKLRGAPQEILDALGRNSTAEQARPVDDCVRRFTRAEINGITVGRFGPAKFFPAIGDYQRKKLEAAEDTYVGQVRDAIALAVGLGYVFMSGIEDEGEPLGSATTEEIWNVWAPGLNSGLAEATAMPEDMLSDLRRMGADAFLDRAVALGLGGFRKKSPLERSGAFYAQAGAVLRACQMHQEELVPDPVNAWPYSDHPA